jgi:hypothetical protein
MAGWIITSLWPLGFQCAGNLTVHVTDDLHAAPVFFTGDLELHDSDEFLGELHDVDFISEERILAGAVALEEDLFDEFFT